MTRRRRSTGHDPLIVAAGLLLAAVVALDVLRVLGWLLVVGAVVAVAYAAGRKVRHTGSAYSPPQPRMPNGNAEPPHITAERDQHAAQVADLQRQLAEARDSAHAAWDAAASVTPRAEAGPGDTDDRRAGLLADPLSGARPLGRQP